MPEVSVTLSGFDQLQKSLAQAAKEIPSASRNALNDTARGIQREFKTTLSRKFVLEKARTFTERQVFIGRDDLATKTKLEARVSIQGPGGAPSFLTKFERDKVKVAQSGRLAIPVRDIRTKGGHVARAYAFKNFMPIMSVGGQFTKLRRSKGKLVAGKTRNIGTRQIGQRGSFVIRLKTGDEGLAIRKKGQPLKLLYVFKPRTPIPDSLHFHDDAHAAAQRIMPGKIDEAISHALRRAGIV